MATRMQQRRGTEAQWTDADPILAAGEIGFETDTGKFKVGDGTNNWSDLSYFLTLDELGGNLDDYIPLTQRGANNGVATLDAQGKIPVAQLANVIDGAESALDTLNELAAALGDDANFSTTITNAIANRAKAVSKTATEWASDTSQTPAGQVSVESDTGKIKITTVAGATYAETDYVVSLDDLNTAITALGISQISTDLSAAEGAIETLQQDFTNINTNVGNVEDDVADLVTDLGSVTSRVSNLETFETSTTSTLSDIDTELGLKAPIESPQFTGNVSLPETTSIGAVSSTEIGYLNGVTSSVQTQLDNKQGAVAGISATEIGYLDGVTSNIQTQIDGKQDAVSGVSSTEIGYLDGVTSAIQTQLDGKASSTHTHSIADVTGLQTAIDEKADATTTQTALDGKASLAGATFTGNVEVDGNLVVDGDLTVNGTSFNASSTTIVIEDNMVQLAHQNAGNTVDLGLVVAYNDGAAKHSGIVRDVSDSKWKLFKDVTTEPTTTVAFGEGSLDNLAVNNVEVAGVVFTDGTQTKQGVPSITTITPRTASYTLSNLNERDTIIEISNASATTLTIPTNASVAYPVGTTLDIIQTGAGQVTIAGAGGVTVNGTPGLKLRTQWSSATLLKRAENTWLVYGDLTA